MSTQQNEACVGPNSEEAGKAASCEGCPNQSACASGANKQDESINEVKARMEEIKHKILVLSGKGGVGKSTVASQLSWALADMDKSVGVLDIDICGPSMPRMMGVENREVTRSNYGLEPVYSEETECIGVMSVGFLLSNRNDAVIWRGPRKDALIKQFLSDVNWGELDYLVVDAPPGTSDEHLAVNNYLAATPCDGAIIVTTPQEISLLDVRKEIDFCRKTNINILGVIENMAGFVCPCCETKSDIFPAATGGARAMCEEMKVKFLGSVPLDPVMLQACEKGQSYLKHYPTASAVPAFTQIVKNVIEIVEADKDVIMK